MKTLAQLKRDLKVDLQIKTVVNNIKPEKNGQIRTIKKLQTNAIVFNDPTHKSGESWLWYPKAQYIKYYDNIIEIYDIPNNYNNFTSNLVFKYEIM